MTSSNEKYWVRWSNFEEGIKSTFKDITNDTDFLDVTISCDGEHHKAHKIILSASSVIFRNLLVKNPAHHPVIVLWDVNPIDIAAIISFMYYGEVEVEEKNLKSFLAVAKRLRVRGIIDEETADKAKPSEPSEASICSVKRSGISLSSQTQDIKSDIKHRLRKAKRAPSPMPTVPSTPKQENQWSTCGDYSGQQDHNIELRTPTMIGNIKPTHIYNKIIAKGADNNNILLPKLEPQRKLHDDDEKKSKKRDDKIRGTVALTSRTFLDGYESSPVHRDDPFNPKDEGGTVALTGRTFLGGYESLPVQRDDPFNPEDERGTLALTGRTFLSGYESSPVQSQESDGDWPHCSELDNLSGASIETIDKKFLRDTRAKKEFCDMNMEHRDGKIFCLLCSKEFVKTYCFIRHIETVHFQDAVTCQSCGLLFANNGQLYNHSIKNHT